VNVYRPRCAPIASVNELAGKSSPRRAWMPLLDERFARWGAYLNRRAFRARLAR
jgi:hypothetical protein